MSRAIAAAVMILSLPLAAAAQPGVPATPASQGPMVVERVETGFLVAPDVKVTKVDGVTSELAGAYAGWLTDGTIFVGGGGYWMANNSSDRQMAYGGLIVQWLAPANDRFGFSLKGLVGGGQATLATNVTQVLPLPVGPFPTEPIRQGVVTNARIRFRKGFLSPNRKWACTSGSPGTCGSPAAAATGSPPPTAATSTVCAVRSAASGFRSAAVPSRHKNAVLKIVRSTNGTA